MASVNAYLRFDGKCRQAMTFYKECLGGELKMQTIAESPMAGQFPPEAKQRIMHSSLTNENVMLMASDMLGKDGLMRGNSIALSLNCSSDEEIKKLFSKLSSGGKVMAPLKTEFWGGEFGMLIDKFGMEWMLSYDKTMEKKK